MFTFSTSIRMRLLTSFALALAPLAAAETLKVNGSTTVNLPVAEAAEILRAEQKMEIQMDTQGGSAGGISMLGDGLVQMGMSSKHVSADERAKYPQSDEAVLAFENVSRLEGVNPTNSFNLNLAREMKQFGALAVRSFRTGYDLYVKGDRAGALAAFEAATGANPNYQKAWTWLGRSRYETGDFHGAAEAYSVALKLDPNDKNSQYWLRQARSKIG